jgi:hypothetical protein
MAEQVVDSLVALLRATREAEREVFGALDPTVRDQPMRPGDWSPKDHQAHLTAWKARQANRFAAGRRGEEPGQTPDGETDAINAELQAARADWTWDAIVEEAEEVSERLIREVSATDPESIAKYDQLIGGSFGIPGPFHAMTHFGWLEEAKIGVDPERLAAFIEELRVVVDDGGLPPVDSGTALYNIACYHALGGRLDEARALLREAFQLRPDLAEYSLEDTDLTALRGELEALAQPTSA